MSGSQRDWVIQIVMYLKATEYKSSFDIRVKVPLVFDKVDHLAKPQERQSIYRNKIQQSCLLVMIRFILQTLKMPVGIFVTLRGTLGAMSFKIYCHLRGEEG